MSEEKRCRGCGLTKVLDEFGKERRVKDGRQARCRDCQNTRTRHWRKQNSEKQRAASQRWKEANPGRKAETDRRWVEANRAKIVANVARWQERNPKAARAHVELNRAVARGELEKSSSCKRCGRSPEPRHLHGHHEDYSKPLDVEWLCVRCHNDLHLSEKG